MMEEGPQEEGPNNALSNPIGSHAQVQVQEYRSPEHNFSCVDKCEFYGHMIWIHTHYTYHSLIIEKRTSRMIVSLISITFHCFQLQHPGLDEVEVSLQCHYGVVVSLLYYVSIIAKWAIEKSHMYRI